LFKHINLGRKYKKNRVDNSLFEWQGYDLSEILAGLKKWWPVALPLFAKVAFSGFFLGNRQKIAVVANATFFRQGGKMAGA
jgi:hypothetical protein